MHNKKIKIVHILEGFLGGTSTYMCTVLPQLVLKGFDVTLICSLNRSCPDIDTKVSELQASGVKVYIVPIYREIKPIKDIQSLIICLRLFSKYKFDIIHTHCSKAGALGRCAGILTGKNLRVHTPHCFAFTRCTNRFERTLYFALEKIFGKFTTMLITVSKSEADIVLNSRIVTADKCTIVENGLSNGKSYSNHFLSIKRSLSKQTLGIDKNVQIVTTACRLVKYKGIFRFLEAAAISRTPKVVFLIAGDGELISSAEKFIVANKLSNKVKLLGHVSEMEQLYAISDIIALCSDAEAQPYLLLEAMRAKCPVVATSVIGNKELISHGRTGTLVEPSPNRIARAIDELLTDRDKRIKYTENAYDYFCRHHTLDKQLLKLTNIYQSLM